jgi:hypothetical protein
MIYIEHWNFERTYGIMELENSDDKKNSWKILGNSHMGFFKTVSSPSGTVMFSGTISISSNTGTVVVSFWNNHVFWNNK